MILQIRGQLPLRLLPDHVFLITHGVLVFACITTLLHRDKQALRRHTVFLLAEVLCPTSQLPIASYEAHSHIRHEHVAQRAMSPSSCETGSDTA